MRLSLLSFFFLIGFATQSSASEFYTDPSKWKEPRIYHTQIEDKQFANNVVLTQAKCERAAFTKNEIFSSNKAYSYILRSAKGDATKGETLNFELEVYNERFCTDIEMKSLYPNFSPPQVSWINEKLIFVNLAWGRIFGAYFIFDVETGKIIKSEYWNDGHDIFQQYH